jgi:hypothetical protein
MNIKLNDLKTIIFFAKEDLRKSINLIDYFDKKMKENDSDFYRKQYEDNLNKIKVLEKSIKNLEESINNLNMEVSQ